MKSHMHYLLLRTYTTIFFSNKELGSNRFKINMLTILVIYDRIRQQIIRIKKLMTKLQTGHSFATFISNMN
jgi:hypothetical protein